MENKVPKISRNYLKYGAFVLGLATAIAVRALIILSYVQPTWVHPIWYFAVLGNFVFFYYRFSFQCTSRSVECEEGRVKLWWKRLRLFYVYSFFPAFFRIRFSLFLYGYEVLRNFMVEMRRFELLTPCLQGRCSPN